MADLFPMYRTDGERCSTVVVMSPTDYVFFEVPQDHKERHFCEASRHIGTLTDIVSRVNLEIDSFRDTICESMVCRADTNPAFAQATYTERKDWIDAWVRNRLGLWLFTKIGIEKANNVFGVALADLPQVLLAGMTADLLNRRQDYAQLLYRYPVSGVTPFTELMMSWIESRKDCSVKATCFAAGKQAPSGASADSGDENRDGDHPGEVRTSVR